MDYCIVKTDIKGVAVFSNRKILCGEILGEYIGFIPNKNGRKLYNGMYESEILGRYCNHNDNPNTKLIKIEDNSILLMANCDINIGDEITTNYINVENLMNVPYLTYYKEHFTNVKLYDFGNIMIN